MYKTARFRLLLLFLAVYWGGLSTPQGTLGERAYGGPVPGWLCLSQE
jgi:hypothetical protein